MSSHDAWCFLRGLVAAQGEPKDGIVLFVSLDLVGHAQWKRHARKKVMLPSAVPGVTVEARIIDGWTVATP